MISLRAATVDDAAALLAVYGAFVVTNAVSYETTPPTVEVMRERIAATIDQYPWIVGCDPESGFVVGYAFAKPVRPGPAYRFAVETACYVGGAFVGQGTRRALYSALIATLVQQDYTQAIASLTMPQDAAIQLHEAMGFKRGGVYREVSYKNGQWIDVGIWQRELAQPNNPPDDPRAFSAVGVVRG